MSKHCNSNTFVSDSMPSEVTLEGVIERAIVNSEWDNFVKRNQSEAEHNRRYFNSNSIYAVNIVSSPGGGKTSIVEETIPKLIHEYTIGIIGCDIKKGVDCNSGNDSRVSRIYRGANSGCYIDAFMVRRGVLGMHIPQKSVMFIENVVDNVMLGRLDIGEQLTVAVISVTDGDDKPLKHPHIFKGADVCIINKVDLLPYLRSNIETLRENIISVNSNIEIFELSTYNSMGVDLWCDFLINRVYNIGIS